MISDTSYGDEGALEEQHEESKEGMMKAIDEVGTLGGVIQHRIEVLGAKLLSNKELQNAEYCESIGSQIVSLSKSLKRIQKIYSSLLSSADELDKALPE